MHKIHSEGQAGEPGNEGRGLFALDAAEEEEGAEGCDDHVRHAELPGPFQFRGLDKYARGAGVPERPSGESRAGEETEGTGDGATAAAPVQMDADVVRHNQIAQITGTVPEHCEAVPETFAPYLRIEETVYPRNEGAETEYAQKDQLLLGAGLLEPGRNDWYYEVKADQRVHEPQMSGHGREVERQMLQVGERLLNAHSAPEQGQQAVQQREEDPGREYAREAFFVEAAHPCPRLHRHEQEGGGNHEQRDAGPGHEAVVECHPEAVAFVKKH